MAASERSPDLLFANFVIVTMLKPMSNPRILLTLLLPLVTCFCACPTLAGSDNIVVLVSVDGLAHYYFDDPKAEMPTIRRLAKEGARAGMMRASMPTVTWPNHTTLVTGVDPARHGVIGNSYFDRAKGEVVQLIVDPIFNKEELVTSPTIYDVAKKAGLRTASILWPATRGAPSLDWTMPEVGSMDLIEKYSTPGLLNEFKEAGIPYEMNIEWRTQDKGRIRDRMFMQMFNHVIRVHQTNLALLHLVELDHVEHAHGPQSPEAYSAVKFEDQIVFEVWNALQTYYPGRATLIVASDHGFLPYRRQIMPNVLLRQDGLLTAIGSKITGGKVRALAQGGASFIYIQKGEDRAVIAEQITKRFREMEGVDLVIEPADFVRYGLADASKDPRMPDLILSAKPGYSFTDIAGGEVSVTPESHETKGSHGFDPNQPGMHASFVAWGAGIRPGATLGTISNTSVAPTIGALLGLKMEGTDGKVLDEILGK